jgi:hypothetical protein
MPENPPFDLVLVACCGAKLIGRHPARELYQSHLFRKSRTWAENHGERWAILSALYGVVLPDREIPSYDQTLNSMQTSARHEWDRKVLEALIPLAPQRVAVLAGKNYCGWIKDAPFDVSRPMEGLGIGEQLAWLTKQNAAVQLDLL